MSNLKRKRHKRAHSAPLVALSEAARLIPPPRACDASGESLVGLATVHARRPIIRLFRRTGDAFAALAKLHAQGDAK